jgi:plasmid stabilization system protein ParE
MDRKHYREMAATCRIESRFRSGDAKAAAMWSRLADEYERLADGFDAPRLRPDTHTARADLNS